LSKIGFVGVGLMGHGMVSRLMAAGHRLTIIAHRNRAPVDDLVAKGAREVASLAELARGQDAIFICVTGTPEVESVVGDMAPHLAPGQFVIDTSTAEPGPIETIAGNLAAKGVQFIDAPVGGGAQHAARGELSSMVGASEADFAAVLPWLKATSKLIVRMGEVGAGHRAKLLNNLLALGQAALVAEAYTLARAQGIDWQSLFDVNMGGAARSGSLERMIPPAIAGDYRGYLFTTANAVKDLQYFVTSARAAGADTLIGEALRTYFADAAVQHGPDAMLSELLKPR
jgi:3-hydroxyisobutyrate dehydrogenase-like beta-hydroxyacid dehydrogenase